MDEHHLGYITKLESKKEKRKKTLVGRGKGGCPPIPKERIWKWRWEKYINK
jgi:hypothetical protein